MRLLARETPTDWSIQILSPADQAQYDRLWHVLVQTLGLDWMAPAGSPDGHELADDCAAALWDAGFRIPDAAPETTTYEAQEGAR